MPPIDRRRLTTDLYLQEEVARAIGDRLQATHPNGSSVDKMEAAFTAAVVQTAELIMLPQKRRMPGLGWNGDGQEVAEFSLARAARSVAWRRQKADPQGSQAQRDVSRACRNVKRVRLAAYDRFLKRHVLKLEEQLHRNNQ